MVELNPAIKQYFSEIGAKGGHAGAGTPKNRNPAECQANARRAARIRWAKTTGVPKRQKRVIDA